MGKDKNAVTTASAKDKKVTIAPVSPVSNSLTDEVLVAHLINEQFLKNQELKESCPLLYQEYAQNFNVCMLLGIVNVRERLLARAANGELVLKIPVDQLMPIAEVADALGIELIPNKQLPETIKDGQGSLDFTEVTLKVPGELTEKGDTPEEIVITDPTLITTEQELKDALAFILNANEKTKNVLLNMIDAVEFYKAYLVHNAKDSEKELVSKMSLTDALNEILGKVNVSGLYTGIAAAMYNYTRVTESPVMSYGIAYKYLHERCSNIEIASLVNLLIRQKALKNKEDDPSKYATDKVIEIMENLDAKKAATLLVLSEDITRKVFGSVKANILQVQGKPENEEEYKKQIIPIFNYFLVSSEKPLIHQEEVEKLIEKEEPKQPVKEPKKTATAEAAKQEKKESKKEEKKAPEEKASEKKEEVKPTEEKTPEKKEPVKPEADPEKKEPVKSEEKPLSKNQQKKLAKAAAKKK